MEQSKQRIGLTPRQQQVLAFLVAYQKNSGVYPTVREICKGRIDGKQAIKAGKRTNSRIAFQSQLTRNELMCQLCNQSGQTAKNCPCFKIEEILCNFCKKPGHMVRDLSLIHI